MTTAAPALPDGCGFAHMHKRLTFFVGCLAVAVLPGCSPPLRTTPAWIATGSRGMVASDSALASRAGLEILQAGGNAIDAACAVSFALAVTRPESTGLGGGGFLIARFADGRYVVADFRERAPARARPDLYAAVEAGDQGPPASRIGYPAVAVPGLLAGRAETLERYGTCSLAEVLQPAIRLARDGFRVDEHYVRACRAVAEHYARYPSLKKTCGYVYRVHLRSGDLRKPGDRLVQPELARLLEALAQRGPDVFYKGEVARAIARAMADHGGLIGLDDLAGYRVAFRTPVTTQYRGFEVVSMPPPSSGGTCLIEALNILEHVELAVPWPSDRATALHFVAEAMKHAFADRARWMGDADFVPVPTGLLTSKAYAAALAAGLNPAATDAPETYGALQIPDDAGTSHFCVVDRWGNCVVSTETINTTFGSLAAVDEWGLILNNEMDDFTTAVGRPNVFGLVQSSRNVVEPGKRPLSSMTPTIVLRDDKPFLLLGASGGPRIISSVLNVILGVTDFELTLEEAMTARRIHHQWSPDEVVFDDAVGADLARGLKARGHVLAARHQTGVVQAIRIDGGRLTGACDPRKGGRPSGY